MNVRAIREAIASDATSAAQVRRAFPFIPAKLLARQLPAVIVGNPAVTYNRTGGDGHVTLTIPVWALISEAIDPDRGTELLDGFVSEELATSAAPASLATALRQRAATDARPWTVHVDQSLEYTLVKIESADYYAVELSLIVRT